MIEQNRAETTALWQLIDKADLSQRLMKTQITLETSRVLAHFLTELGEYQLAYNLLLRILPSITSPEPLLALGITAREMAKFKEVEKN